MGPWAGREQSEDSEPGGERLRARVLEVTDGDTVVVRLESGEVERVRYIGVDTPESTSLPVECFGQRAAAVNRGMVGGRVVSLEPGIERRDDYGRLLAYVRRGGTFVNAELVRRGLARTLTIAPNNARAGLFERLEKSAARNGTGLWGIC